MSYKPPNKEAELILRDAEARRLLDDGLFVRFVLRLVESAGIYQTTQRADPYATSHAEGRRALGLEMLDMLLAARPDALVTIMQEHLAQNRDRKPDGRPDPRNDDRSLPGDDDA